MEDTRPARSGELSVLTPNEFRLALDEIFRTSWRNGADVVVVVSGDLHRKLGGYPGANHQMPVCCDAMRAAMQGGDQVLEETPGGKGATLRIQYKIPR
jgi:5-methylcytosine-specific restriction protein A